MTSHQERLRNACSGREYSREGLNIPAIRTYLNDRQLIHNQTQATTRKDLEVLLYRELQRCRLPEFVRVRERVLSVESVVLLLYGTSNVNENGSTELLIYEGYSELFLPTALGHVVVKRGKDQGFGVTTYPEVRLPFNLDGTKHPEWLAKAVITQQWEEQLTFLLVLNPLGLEMYRELRESDRFARFRGPLPALP